MFKQRLLVALGLGLATTACADLSRLPILSPGDTPAGNAYEIQRSYVLPHFLEVSGRITAPSYKIIVGNDCDDDCDGFTLASVWDLDGDGLGDRNGAPDVETSLKGLEVDPETGAIALRDPSAGGELTVRYRPGRPVFGNITFDGASLAKWVNDTRMGKGMRKRISIVSTGRDGTERSIDLYDCYPTAWREAGSGMATGRRQIEGPRPPRDPSSGLPSGRTVGAGQVSEIVTIAFARAINNPGVK